MTQSVLKAIAAKSSLDLALKDVAKNKNKRQQASLDHQNNSIEQLKDSAHSVFKSVGRRIRSNDYSFSDLKPVFVPKSDGGNRIICVPTVIDRVTQRALLNTLTSYQGGKYAFRSTIGYGVDSSTTTKKALDKCIQNRSSHPWVYKTDITKFFDRVDRETLKALVKTKIHLRSLHDLLFKVIDCEVIYSSQTQKRKLIANGILENKGVRQGMPLSPYLANLYLAGFDKAIEEKGANAIRYADDLVFFCDSKSECEDLHAFCMAYMVSIGLSIPDLGDNSKSKIASPDETVDFLGIAIALNGSRYSLSLSDSQLEKIRSNIDKYNDLAFCASNDIDIRSLYSRLEATVFSYYECYEGVDNFEELKSQLGRWKNQTYRSVFGQLGIDIDKLDKNKRDFLGLINL